MDRFRFLLAAIIIGAPVGLAQHMIPIAAASGTSNIKVENGMVICYAADSTNAVPDDVEIFDTDSGAKLLSVSTVSVANGFTAKTIWDVSAKRDQAVAIAVDFQSATNQVAPMLLLYDWSGHLQHATRLPRDKDIYALEIDDAGNVWTLTQGAGDLEPSQASMVNVFGPEGRFLNGFFPRSLFERHETDTLTGFRAGGHPSFGIVSGQLWFWLPGSALLSRTGLNDSRINIMKSVVPTTLVSDGQAGTVALLSSGRLLMEYSWRRTPQEPFQRGLFVWAGAKWSRAISMDKGELFLGVDNQDAFFLDSSSNSSLVNTGILIKSLPISGMIH